MKISSRIPVEALATARGVLLPYVPELTTTMLVKAIENYNREDGVEKKEKPEQMTIMEVAKLLRVSRITVFRYITRGILVANHVSKRKVLIDAESVLKLLNAV